MNPECHRCGYPIEVGTIHAADGEHHGQCKAIPFQRPHNDAATASDDRVGNGRAES